MSVKETPYLKMNSLPKDEHCAAVVTCAAGFDGDVIATVPDKLVVTVVVAVPRKL